MGVREDQRKIVETGMAGASSLLGMIDEFLELARADQWKKEKVVLVPLSITDLVQKELVVIQPLAAEKSIGVDIPNGKDVRVLGDQTMVKHLMQNLLSNAVKYTPKGGKIRVDWEVFSSRRASDFSKTMIKIWVEDSGIGIEQESREIIFEKFSRTSQARSSGIRGTGIGLYLCRKLIGLLGGKLWVEDSSLNGTRFCFTLFVSEEHENV
jgi:two-component system sensor histidine kinase KdpD